jgi:hypothetical protein
MQISIPSLPLSCSPGLQQHLVVQRVSFGPRDAPAPGELLGSMTYHAEMIDGIILALGATASGVLVEM